MRQSQLFTKTKKEPPADEEAKNARLLIQAGFINKEMAGVYDFLPLGLRTRNNIEQIIREEMEAVGGQEVNFSGLQSKNVWQKTDRWDIADDELWFKSNLANGGEVGLGWSHEEPMTQAMTQHINSYRDLPVKIYQFQTKFRNELRAKAGIMRGREFLMKDLYSFARNAVEHKEIYDAMKSAYERIFARAGIGDNTVYTYADGGSFSDFSHEFQTESAAGEDTIFVDDDQQIAVNQEVMSPNTLAELELAEDDLRETTAIEVGNIFPLGAKYSQAIDLHFTQEDGQEAAPIMGSYGIGVGRLMGAIVEVLGSEDNLLWPESVAPFQVHVLQFGDDEDVIAEARTAYKTLQGAGIETLFDDRTASPGEKFADSDLFGFPIQVVVSENTLERGELEVTFRRFNKEDRQAYMELSDLITTITDQSHA